MGVIIAVIIWPNGAGFVVIPERYPQEGAQSSRLTVARTRNPATPWPRILGPGGQGGLGGQVPPGPGGPRGVAPRGKHRHGLGGTHVSRFHLVIVRRDRSVTRWAARAGDGASGPGCAGGRS